MQVPRHHSALILAAVVTVASFLGSTAFTQVRLARVDALSATIETNGVPSVDYLARAAVELTRINDLLDDAQQPGEGAQEAIRVVRQAVAELQRNVAQYLALPPLPGEQRYWDALRSDTTRAVALVAGAMGGPDQALPAVISASQANAIDDALDAAERSVSATLEYDVNQSESMAAGVRSIREQSLHSIVALDALASIVALVSVALAYRATRDHDRLLREHAALLDVRIDELDRFAGRVAHDVLNPLGTIVAALSLLGRSADEHARAYVERCQRASQRIEQLVDGLLAFARAGGSPDGASCAADTVIANVIADCGEAAAACRVELVADGATSAMVPCRIGVLTSILENLVRNAIKYMDAAPTRRVTVRTFRASAGVRFEVEDTGPGIPAAIQTTLFQPFVRGPRETVNGSGLGLATVKRLVERHGGCVGVRPATGRGSLFWVELPTVGHITAPPLA